MAKGDDAVARKKNKARRKKLQKEEGSSSNVSARVASIIAAKKRRLSGKRRKCQGMCFSLPTPDDPFNDQHGGKVLKKKDTRNAISFLVDERVSVKGKDTAPSKNPLGGKNVESNHLEQKSGKVINNSNVGQKDLVNCERTKTWWNGEAAGRDHQGKAGENSDCPSKFLMLCLNAIEKALRDEGTYNGDEEKHLYVDPWGIEFLKCYSNGKDVLETSGSSCTIDQTAWMVSVAADTIARKEKKGQAFTSPFLLFLVPSQEKATEVRMVCKPLKALGIHTVSLHPGASLDHQITGLRSCEPEFLVSTPERLLELVSLKAIDISGISFFVVDGLESLYKTNCFDALRSIRQSISGEPHTVLFNDFHSYNCIPALQNLLLGSVCRLSLSHSISSQSACIIQAINLCSSEEEKLSKVFQVLHQAFDSHLFSEPIKVLYIVGKHRKTYNIAKILKHSDYSVSVGSESNIMDGDGSQDSIGKMKPVVSVMNTEHIGAADLGAYEIVILHDFVTSIDDYVQILTRMARHSVKGVLHSFLSQDSALLAGPLIEILEECGQAVPESLRNLHLQSLVMASGSYQNSPIIA